MFKATPNPPHNPLDARKLDKAAQKALDHYLKPDTPEKPARQLDYFIVAPDADPEGMLAHTYETFCSVSTLILDLSEDLEGAPRNLALAIHQMGEMGVLLLEKLLDNEAKVQR
ncbi:DUF6124 family protein [Pseudomonas sp. NFACC45]|uniref:DUF6124 family protein n=1 Tax=Pseudomonas sp. NFACC45 TaxID=1566201 RepID=UPI0008F34446|nr:DUF6124 family protein [Pseudomonas sp. NFACC45]SFH10618.1 hypothetical protein SAMN03159297_03144 [Pseudomonas sp. NFACC45]